MTPSQQKRAERWRRQRARDLGITGRLTGAQRSLLKAIQFHEGLIERADTDMQRSTLMMRVDRLTRTLCSFKVSRRRSLRH